MTRSNLGEVAHNPAAKAKRRAFFREQQRLAAVLAPLVARELMSLMELVLPDYPRPKRANKGVQQKAAQRRYNQPERSASALVRHMTDQVRECSSFPKVDDRSAPSGSIEGRPYAGYFRRRAAAAGVLLPEAQIEPVFAEAPCSAAQTPSSPHLLERRSCVGAPPCLLVQDVLSSEQLRRKISEHSGQSAWCSLGPANRFRLFRCENISACLAAHGQNGAGQ